MGGDWTENVWVPQEGMHNQSTSSHLHMSAPAGFSNKNAIKSPFVGMELNS